VLVWGGDAFVLRHQDRALLYGAPTTTRGPSLMFRDNKPTRTTTTTTIHQWQLLQQPNDKDSNNNDDIIIEYDDFDELFGAGSDVIGGDDGAPSQNSVSFDDFGGSLVGGDNDDMPTTESTSTFLQDRMQAVQQQERRSEAVLGRNWKLGNWQVRGFSLEQHAAGAVVDSTSNKPSVDETTMGSSSSEPVQQDPDSTTATAPSVCWIAKSSDDDDQIWVGRTDGSVFGVQLGTDYWTKLLNNNQNNGDEWLDDTATAPRLSEGSLTLQDDDEDEMPQQQQPPPPSNPFAIRAQCQASSDSSPVTALVAHHGDDDGTSYLFTATADRGLQQWLVLENDDDDDDQQFKLIPAVSFEGAHDSSDNIFALKAVALETSTATTATVLLSADRHTLAVWDATTGDLLGQSRPLNNDENDDIRMECVDTDGTHVYVGTSDGQVRAYRLAHLLDNSSNAAALAPVGQWQASSSPDTAITAIHCGDSSMMGSTTQTRTLYTGDGSGTVKQWHVFARGGNHDSERLEQWPKLPTQRLPKKAHLFQKHDAPVRAIEAVDGTKFVTAAADGTVRAWNAATGRELFCMDGFSADLHSLCLLDSVVTTTRSSSIREGTASNTVLVTDGMDKYVCVHDFTHNPDEDDDADYELEMPEYRDQD